MSLQQQLQEQIDHAQKFSALLKEFDIPHWLGGGIATEILRDKIEDPVREHGDIDFHIFEAERRRINSKELVKKASDIGFQIREGVPFFYKKMAFVITGKDYELEIPYIVRGLRKMYFKAWDKERKMRHYTCKEDYFGSDEYRDIPIVSKAYCDDLYPSFCCRRINSK